MRITLLFLFLGISLSGWSQDWQYAVSDRIPFYAMKDSIPSPIYAFVQDSVTVSGGDTTYHFRRHLSPMEQWDPQVQSDCPGWGGANRYWDPPWTGSSITVNDTVVELSTLIDTIRIPNYLNPGQWTRLGVIDTFLNEAWAGHLVEDTATIFGSLDSTRTYLIEIRNSAGIPIPHHLNWDTLKISKEWGILEFFSVNPHELMPIEMIGSRNPDVGVNGLKESEAFNYNVGDTIMDGSSFNYGVPGSNSVSYVKVVIDKQVVGSTITYSLQRDRVSCWHCPDSANPQIDTITLVVSSSYELFSPGLVIQCQEWPFWFIDDCGYKSRRLTITSPSAYYYCSSHPQHNVCQTWDMNGTIIYTDYYTENWGFEHYRYEVGWFSWSVSDPYIAYASLNGNPCGSPLIIPSVPLITSQTLLIHPNPTTSTAMIDVQEIGDGIVQVYDPTGKLLLEEQIANGVEQHEIDLGGVERGLYLVRVVGGGVPQYGRIVKE